MDDIAFSPRQVEDRTENDDTEGDDVDDDGGWWFASAYCPIIAGASSPLAITFGICSLTTHWRVFLPIPQDNQTIPNESFLADPRWLVALTSTSFAIAVVANTALLLNFARRLRFDVAQPVTIIGSLIAAVLLIIAIAIASHSSFLEHSPTYGRSQAFYYAIWAAILYVIIAVLMTITTFGFILGKYPRQFQLTSSQRTLMLQTIAFMTYLLAGAAVFAAIEDWQFLEAVFWADNTLLTLGLGPWIPSTHAAKSLLFVYAVGGLINVGIIIASIRSTIVESSRYHLQTYALKIQRRRAKTYLDSQKHSDALPQSQNNDHSEFVAMQRLRIRARQISSWTSLAVSVMMASTLWFVGAAIFKSTEHEQEWSYFDAVYFSYTVLLTVSYGDYSPQSNAGKAFFVFFTLLAVPTLTILVGDMSDTVVKFVVDVVSFAANLTVLPNSTIANLIDSVKFSGKKTLPKDSSFLQDTDSQAYTNPPDPKTEMTDKVTSQRTAQTQSMEPRERRLRLLSAIRLVARDQSTFPSKKYTYDEWQEFFTLLRGDDDRPALSRWTDPHGPLLGDLSEQEWLFERLVKKLEAELEGLK